MTPSLNTKIYDVFDMYLKVVMGAVQWSKQRKAIS